MNNRINQILMAVSVGFVIGCMPKTPLPAPAAPADTTAPILTEAMAVPTPSNDTTPSYTFSSDEAGAITYGGDCSSTTSSAVSGNNTVIFDTLTDGVYNNCTITVKDAANNISELLDVSTFTIDVTAPVLTKISGIASITPDPSPSFTFRSTETGEIIYSGICTSNNQNAVQGNNTVTFNTLDVGTYSDCKVSVKDLSGNISQLLNVGSFKIQYGIVTTGIGNEAAATSMVLQNDEKIIVAGYSYNGSNYDFALARYNIDGSLDTTFSNDGIVSIAIGSADDYIYDIALQTDGKIVVAGEIYSADGYSDIGMTRFNSDGSLDTTFSGDGKLTTAIGTSRDGAYSVAIQSNGKIIVSGYSNILASAYDVITLVRYNVDGTLDTTFSGDGKLTTSFIAWDYGLKIMPLASGKIIVAGRSYIDTGNTDFALLRYNSDGSVDTTFSTDGKLTTAISPFNDHVNSAHLLPDGKIILGGSTSKSSGSLGYALARYNSNGSLDSAFDTDGIMTYFYNVGTPKGTAVQSDGKYLMTGFIGGSTGDFQVLRFNSDGSLDATFSGDGVLTTSITSSRDEPNTILQQIDGKILVAGSGSTSFALVRYNMDGSLDSSFY